MEIENLDFDTKVRKPSFLVAEEKKKLSKNLTNIFVQNFRQKKSSKYKLKLKMKYEVNVRSDIQIWKPGPDLKTKNQKMSS